VNEVVTSACAETLYASVTITQEKLYACPVVRTSIITRSLYNLVFLLSINKIFQFWKRVSDLDTSHTLPKLQSDYQ